MLKNFQSLNHYPVYLQAVKLVGYEVVKQALLSALMASPNFTQEQKLVIKIAASELHNYPPSDLMAQDGVLIGLMNIDLETLGAQGATPLLPAQREGVMAGLMAICKKIIAGESARLDALTALDTALPAGWNSEEQ